MSKEVDSPIIVKPLAPEKKKLKSSNPTASLTLVPFNGTNFMRWSRQVRLALRAKRRLGYIDGTVKTPKEGTSKCDDWESDDSLVRSWIHHSMTAELSNSLIHSLTANDLWDELRQHYAHNNKPQIYQIRQEIAQAYHGTLFVGAFYCKLKGLWDELDSIVGIPSCECGAIKNCTYKLLAKMLEIINEERLLQFLRRLNSEFEVVRGQVLSTDPMSSLNRAYYLVHRVESQKTITHQGVADEIAMNANSRNSKQQTGASQGLQGQQW